MSASKAPTGLSVTRSGNTFTMKWKIGDKDYGQGQQLQYQINDGKWASPSIGKTATSYAITSTVLKKLVFKVRGNRKKYSKKGKNINPGWSAWASKTWAATVPGNPAVTYENEAVNSGTFKWSFSVDNSGTPIFTRVETQTCVVRKNAAPDAKEWSAVTNRTNAGSVTYTEESESIAQGNIVRWFRARTVGRAGAVKWENCSYYHHAYGAPNAATLLEASASSSGSSSRIRAAWNGSYDRMHPIDLLTLQYAIATPADAAFTPPSSGWSDAIEVAPNGANDTVVVNIADVIGPDEVMWVRVESDHDGNKAYSNEMVAQIGTLAAPGIDANPNTTTGAVTITITENTDCDAACTAIFFRPENDPSNDRIVAILPRNTTTASLTVNDIIGASGTCFGAFAFVGSYSGLVISEMKMQSAKVIDSDIASVAPANVVVSEGPAEGTVRIGWEWSWSEATKAELTWADNPFAWESTDEPKSYEVEDRFALSWVIAGLDIGQRWYFRVRLVDGSGDDDIAGPWSDILSYDLSSVPDRPVLTLSKSVINEGENVTARWAYSSADDVEQGFAEICLVTFDAQNNPVYGDIIAHVDAGQSAEISRDWETGTAYYMAARTTTAAGTQSAWSDPVSLYVAEPVEIWVNSFMRTFDYALTAKGYQWVPDPGIWMPTGESSTANTAEYTQANKELYEKALQNTEEIVSQTETTKSTREYSLTSTWTEPLRTMPLTVTVTGAGVTGTTVVSIVRAEDYHLYRPDDTEYDGYEGETIATLSQTGEDPITITVDDLVGRLDDGAKYKLIATVIDEYGQTASEEILFTVNWLHKAIVPSANVKMDKYLRAAEITPIAQEGAVETDTCDIYRITADQPELVYKGAAFGETYVDPYPAFGDFCGHRLVMVTANGDYATATGLGWYDTDYNDGDILEDKKMVIDVNGDQIELPYNIELSNSWHKDFLRTEYLGGAVQGDWNPAVTRDLSAKTVLLRGRDLDKQLAMRDLAGYAGVAHIRTPDGSSFTCDIQVREQMDYKSKRVSYTLAVQAIDPEGTDGMTLTEWRAMHPIGE